MKQVFKLLRNFLGFVSGFAVAAAIVAHHVPRNHLSGVGAKLDWLEKHAADYDVIFVGSSRMKQLEPEIFDGVFADAGMQVRAFNLGIDGVRPPEDEYLLEHALKGRTTPLRLIVAESLRVSLKIGDEDYGTERMTFWHDTKRMGTIWDRTWSNESKRPLSAGKSITGYWRNLRLLPGHVHHWATNTARVGSGSEWVAKAVGLRGKQRANTEASSKYLGKKLDGFTQRSNAPLDAEKGREYAKALKKIGPLGDSRLDPGDPASQAHFARMAAFARKHGAQLVVVAPPTVSPEVFRPLSAEILFLDFSNPSRYPQLFEPKVRMDNSHLNDTGSKLFTRLVAEQAVAEIVGRSAHKAN